MKTDFTETGWRCVDRIHLALDRDKWRIFIKNCYEASGSKKKFEEFID